MAVVNLHILDETDRGSDELTTTSLARVQVGRTSWQWQKQMLFVRLHPHLVGDPPVAHRFREVLAAWVGHTLPHQPTMLHAEPHADPFAVFEFEPGHALDAVFASLAFTRPLSRGTADRIIESVYRGLAARHELGFAHGAVGLDRIAVTEHGVDLGIGAPWSRSATREGDLRRADALARDMLARTRVVTPPGWLALGARRPS